LLALCFYLQFHALHQKGPGETGLAHYFIRRHSCPLEYVMQQARPAARDD
jgi:hypothetical protein